MTLQSRIDQLEQEVEKMKLLLGIKKPAKASRRRRDEELKMTKQLLFGGKK